MSNDLGPVAPTHSVSFLALLRYQQETANAAATSSMYNPESNRFGHYLSRQEWKKRFGPSRHDVKSARVLLKRWGISSSWDAPNSFLLVRGPARAIERVFSVKIDAYAAPSGRRFYAAARDPVIPRSLAPFLNGTGHICSFQDRAASLIPVEDFDLPTC